MDVRVTVDRAGPDGTGDIGVAPALLDDVAFDPRSTTAMVCGPEAMMRFTARALERRGIGQDHVFVSMERNMKCGCGFCGHCQLGPFFICKEGPIFPATRMRPWMDKYEL